MNKLENVLEDYKANSGVSPNGRQLIEFYKANAHDEDVEEKQLQIVLAKEICDTNHTDKESPLYLNQDHQVKVSGFKDDARPDPNKIYFTEEFYEKDGLAVVIPFFNEPASELCTTLSYLHDTYQYLCNNSDEWHDKPFHICIIQDGWYKADPSMQQYLKLMFPGKIFNHNNKFVNWWETNEFTNYNEKRDGKHNTYIFEKYGDCTESYFSLKHPVTYIKGKLGKTKHTDYLPASQQPKMNITLLVKIDNRRKHNSHEWFLGKQGFVDAMQAKYFFCTDAYTMFKENTLCDLVLYLDKYDECCGVTGRQRAMNRRQQKRKGEERKTKEWTFSIDYLLRLTQIYDFELAGCVFNPTYHLIGFLPVLPGPCGLYRTSDIINLKPNSKEEDGREWYFDIVNKEPTQTGLVLGNLRIAEDRVLSYASILKSKEGNRRLAFVPSALFYFEAEVDLDRFIFQRRRWINGTFAGYLFLLISEPQILWEWNANFFRKLFVFFVLLLNLIQMAALIISPALSFVIFESSLSYILSLRYDHYEALTDVVILANWCIWIAHVIIHNTNKFNAQIIKFLYILSMIISITLVAAFFHVFVIQQESVLSVLKLKQMSQTMVYFVIYLMLFTFSAPFINALLVDRGRLKCFGLVCKTVIPFYLSFYLMIPWFSSYAFARCWDLTWGNRPSSTELDSHDSANNPLQISVNVVGEEEHSDMEEAKTRFANWSKVVVLFMIFVNVLLYLVVPLYYQALLMAGILIATALFMAISMVQLIGSIIVDMTVCMVTNICRCCGYMCCGWKNNVPATARQYSQVIEDNQQLKENEENEDSPKSEQPFVSVRT